MKNNKTLLSIFGLLFLVYLWLYANEFEIRTRTEYWIFSTKVILFLIMSVLILLLQKIWWLKLISMIGFIGILIFGLPQTGLWNYSLKKYVAKEKSNYFNFVSEIDKIEEKKLSYISCADGKINARPKLDSIKIALVYPTICQYITELDCVEVSMNKRRDKYLFVMERFIDNGYGLLYCKKELDLSDIFTERINGLEIRNIIKVEKNWYYVSFT